MPTHRLYGKQPYGQQLLKKSGRVIQKAVRLEDEDLLASEQKLKAPRRDLPSLPMISSREMQPVVLLPLTDLDVDIVEQDLTYDADDEIEDPAAATYDEDSSCSYSEGTAE